MAIRETEPEDAGTGLVLLGQKEPITPAVFFKPNGSDAILARLKEEVRRQAAELDISTAKGREAIKSLAYKVARAKTALDEAGAAVVEEQKRTIAEVDGERRKVRDLCDELKDEVRKPVTDWENEEKERIQAHEAAIAKFEKAAAEAAALEDPAAITEMLKFVDDLRMGRSWQEFKQRAATASSLAYHNLEVALARANKRIADQAELERLRKAEAERDQRERDERIAREAREDAERKAAELAQRQRDDAERERQRLENERLQAEARARQAEAQRVADEERHQRELQEVEQRRIRDAEIAEQRRIADEQATARRAQEAADRAAREQEAAVQAERDRQAAAAKKEADEAAARERNRKHVTAVNKEVADHLMINGAPNSLVAEKLVSAIANGRIPNCSIAY